MIAALLSVIIFILLCAFAKQVWRGFIVIAGFLALFFIIGVFQGPGYVDRLDSDRRARQDAGQWCREAIEARDAGVAALLLIDGTDAQRVELMEALAETQRNIEALNCE